MVDVMVRSEVAALDLDVTAIISTISEQEFPPVEPRRYDEEHPRWDATDEIYITYNEDGERALITTGQEDIWNKEHSYQRTGSPRYRVLKGLAYRAVGVATVVGDRARGAAGRLRPGVTDGVSVIAGGDDAAGDQPEVHPDRDGVHPWRGPRRRARDRVEDNGTGSDGVARHTRDRARRSGVQERSEPAFQHEPRSHRHCPGCSGHSRTNRSGWLLAYRAVIGWLIGYLALGYGGGLDISIQRYALLTGLGLLAAYVFRPVWRELAHAEDRRVKGGRGPRD